MEKNVWWLVGSAIVVGGVLGYLVRGSAPAAVIQPAATSTPVPVVAEDNKPSSGWGLHIDAIRHFPANPKMVAHHFCKQVTGMWECQLYDSDAVDARLVGVEVIVDAPTYNSFTAAEKRMWHYHKTEIPKVEAKLPDLSAEEAAEVVKTLEETYGKVYLLWDAGLTSQPVGNPSVNILE